MRRCAHMVCALHSHQRQLLNFNRSNLIVSSFSRHLSSLKTQIKLDKKKQAVYDIPTVPGDKKDTSCPLPAAYSARYVEAAWYDWWVKTGVFSPDYRQQCSDDNAKPFVLCLPPPNVTGVLHLGHALICSIQDALVRWHRMHGRTTLWVPGCDHAGIATQVVVEKQLWRDHGLRRQDIGRDEFIQLVWKWKDEKGDQIYEQMKRLGASLDWDRACFTMDQKLCRAVNEAFVRLHEEGLIYRSNRLINWSCHLRSAISDIEVESVSLPGKTYISVPGYEEQIAFGILESFDYPVINSDKMITVSTTRLETMLGDTAIAVHPDDVRYTALHGKYVQHPIMQDRSLPIVCDQSVDPDFGTGAVKITPAHDYTDYEVATRHDLPSISIIAEDGTITNSTQQFQGLGRFTARDHVREVLMSKGLYRGSSDHAMVLPLCSRSKDVIEPMLKEQWFVKCQDMDEQAMQDVRDKRLKLVPDTYEKQWFDWLGNSRDWCVSRQLWWGHRIPAYYAQSMQDNQSSVWIAAHDETEASGKASKILNLPEDQIVLSQDEDVLDTWFSSALFPFSVFGWPEHTSDYSRFYPTSLLETGSDILFFWVARMVMVGKKLTGQLPFSEVLLHGILRDSLGRKMSKSLGNVIDPLHIIEGVSLQELQDQLERSNLDANEIQKARETQKKDFPAGIPESGTDALRYTLCSFNHKAATLNLDIKQMKVNGAFCNKIWQAFRYSYGHLPEDFQPRELSESEVENPIDLWIMSRLSAMVKSCDRNFQSYDLHLVTQAIRQFIYAEFCDVYLECTKPVLQNHDSSEAEITRQILHHCLDTSLRAISPMMPYLSEELYQRLLSNNENRPISVCIAPYPHPEKYRWHNERVDKEVMLVRDIIKAALVLRQDYNLTKTRVNTYLVVTDSDLCHRLSQYDATLTVMCKAKDMQVVTESSSLPAACMSVFITPHCRLYLDLSGYLDIDKDIQRLEKRQEKFTSDYTKLYDMCEVEGYKKNASEHIQLTNQEKMATYQAELTRIAEVLEQLRNMPR